MNVRGRRGSYSHSTKQERSAVSRSRLLEAAVTAFAERGFYGTSTRDIATATGLSPAAVYVHFDSKEEVLYQISRLGHGTSRRLMEAALAQSEEPTEQLVAVIRAFALDHTRNHTRGRVVNQELEALSPSHRTEIQRIRVEIERAIVDLVARGVDSGDFVTCDPEKSAVALLSLCLDIARWYHGGRWAPEEVADFYAELALRMMRNECGCVTGAATQPDHLAGAAESGEPSGQPKSPAKPRSGQSPRR